MTYTKDTPKETWAERFDKKFVVTCPDKKHIDYGREVLNPKYPDDVKAFISQELELARREIIEKVEKMKSICDDSNEFIDGYNAAIDDVLATLREEKEVQS